MSTETSENQWFGGKPMGSIIRNYNSYYVTLRINKVLVATNTFLFSDHESEKDALAAAKKFKQENSDKFGVTKNRYREFTDEHGHKCLEVSLKHGKSFLCNLEHLKIVEESIWVGQQLRKGNTWYVMRNPNKTLGQKKTVLHRRLYPDLPEVDHINRNGLDNRKCNVRDGSGRVNGNNKREIISTNTSGKNGVNYFSKPGQEYFHARWYDSDGKRHGKIFTVKKYGYDEAFRLACETRDKNRYVPPSPPSVQELEDTGQRGPLPITIHTQTWEIDETLKRLKPTDSLVYDPIHFELYVPDDPRFAPLFIDKRPYFDPGFADFE